MAQSKVLFGKQHTQRGEALSQREVEIVYWISIGKSDWDIAQILGISPKTVNYHVEKVKRKYAVGTRIQAIVAVVKDGLI